MTQVEIDDARLTPQQAYRAMFLFLENYYGRFKGTPPRELAIILGAMRLLNDGTPADPAFKEDWHKCVIQILNEDEPGLFVENENSD
jgi:hypothetical protein